MFSEVYTYIIYLLVTLTLISIENCKGMSNKSNHAIILQLFYVPALNYNINYYYNVDLLITVFNIFLLL